MGFDGQELERHNQALVKHFDEAFEKQMRSQKSTWKDVFGAPI